MKEAADELGVPVIATGLVSSLYRTLQAEGLGGEGNHALVKALENLADHGEPLDAVLLDATMPGRWAAPPAPAMMALSPLSRADMA